MLKFFNFVSYFTSTPINHKDFFRRIPLSNQRARVHLTEGGGGGGTAGLDPPPQSPLSDPVLIKTNRILKKAATPTFNSDIKLLLSNGRSTRKYYRNFNLVNSFIFQPDIREL